MLILAVLIGIIIVVLMERRKEGQYTEEIDDIESLDLPYDGNFWYQGIYYDSQKTFYQKNGYFYTNQMYHENYPMWGEGQKPYDSQKTPIVKE